MGGPQPSSYGARNLAVEGRCRVRVDCGRAFHTTWTARWGRRLEGPYYQYCAHRRGGEAPAPYPCSPPLRVCPPAPTVSSPFSLLPLHLDHLLEPVDGLSGVVIVLATCHVKGSAGGTSYPRFRAEGTSHDGLSGIVVVLGALGGSCA